MQTDKTDFLVIGAGLAGLSFARDAQKAGATVRLLDKGRGVGGRMATRRLGDVRVDHGAQYFTARSERLKTFADAALAENWLQIWSHGFPLWENGAIISRPEGHPRYAPFAGMSDVAKRLASDLDIQTGALVTQIRCAATGPYEAQTDDGRLFTGDALIGNLPPFQLLALTRSLLPDALAAKVEAATHGFLPAWALLATLDADIPGADWPAVEFKNHPVLAFVSRDHTKRGPNAPPALVVHGSGAWSYAHLEDAPQDIEASLRAAATDLFGPIAFRETQMHRWRYAQPTQPLPEKYLWDADARLGCCGDWCGGPRVEGAIESGWSLASGIGLSGD